MTSDSDELDKALRENLKLRHELAANITKAKDSSSSQRLSRGFHRLGLFLVAVPMVAGGVLSVLIALDNANHAKMAHDEQVSLVCAKTALRTDPSSIKNKYTDVPPGFIADDERIDLPKLGCSEGTWQPTAREVFQAVPPSDFSYAVRFSQTLGLCLAVTLVVSLFMYGLVRAIGWVIVGFAAS